MVKEEHIAEWFGVLSKSDRLLQDTRQNISESLLQEGNNSTHGSIVPICEVGIVNVTLEEEPPPGFVIIDKTPSGHDANLAFGNPKVVMYLCYRRGWDRPPIMDFGVQQASIPPSNNKGAVLYTFGHHSAVLFTDKGYEMVLNYKFGLNPNDRQDAFVATGVEIIQFPLEDPSPSFFMLPNVINAGSHSSTYDTPQKSSGFLSKAKQRLSAITHGAGGIQVHLCYRKSICRQFMLAYEPRILSEWSRPSYTSKEILNQVPSVPQFAMPNGAIIEAVDGRRQHHSAATNHFTSFTFSSNSLQPTYGYTLTFREPIAKTSLTESALDQLNLSLNDKADDSVVMSEKAFVILSKWPYSVQFRRFLLHLKHCLSINVPIEPYIYQLLSKLPLPTADDPLIRYNLAPDNKYHLTFPLIDGLPIPVTNESFLCTLEVLGVENMMELFFAVLFEQKIILHSILPQLLTKVADCASKMIHPLRWSFGFFPLLPTTLTEFLQAPQSYIAGVDTMFFDCKPQLELLEEAILFDLDTKGVNFVVKSKGQGLDGGGMMGLNDANASGTPSRLRTPFNTAKGWFQPNANLQKVSSNESFESGHQPYMTSVVNKRRKAPLEKRYNVPLEALMRLRGGLIHASRSSKVPLMVDQMATIDELYTESADEAVRSERETYIRNVFLCFMTEMLLNYNDYIKMPTQPIDLAKILRRSGDQQSQGGSSRLRDVFDLDHFVNGAGEWRPLLTELQLDLRMHFASFINQAVGNRQVTQHVPETVRRAQSHRSRAQSGGSDSNVERPYDHSLTSQSSLWEAGHGDHEDVVSPVEYVSATTTNCRTLSLTRYSTLVQTNQMTKEEEREAVSFERQLSFFDWCCMSMKKKRNAREAAKNRAATSSMFRDQFTQEVTENVNLLEPFMPEKLTRRVVYPLEIPASYLEEHVDDSHINEALVDILGPRQESISPITNHHSPPLSPNHTTLNTILLDHFVRHYEPASTAKIPHLTADRRALTLPSYGDASGHLVKPLIDFGSPQANLKRPLFPTSTPRIVRASGEGGLTWNSTWPRMLRPRFQSVAPCVRNVADFKQWDELISWLRNSGRESTRVERVHITMLQECVAIWFMLLPSTVKHCHLWSVSRFQYDVDSSQRVVSPDHPLAEFCANNVHPLQSPDAQCSAVAVSRLLHVAVGAMRESLQWTAWDIAPTYCLMRLLTKYGCTRMVKKLYEMFAESSQPRVLMQAPLIKKQYIRQVKASLAYPSSQRTVWKRTCQNVWALEQKRKAAFEQRCPSGVSSIPKLEQEQVTKPDAEEQNAQTSSEHSESDAECNVNKKDERLNPESNLNSLASMEDATTFVTPSLDDKTSVDVASVDDSEFQLEPFRPTAKSALARSDSGHNSENLARSALTVTGPHTKDGYNVDFNSGGAASSSPVSSQEVPSTPTSSMLAHNQSRRDQPFDASDWEPRTRPSRTLPPPLPRSRTTAFEHTASLSQQNGTFEDIKSMVAFGTTPEKLGRGAKKYLEKGTSYLVKGTKYVWTEAMATPNDLSLPRTFASEHNLHQTDSIIDNPTTTKSQTTGDSPFRRSASGRSQRQNVLLPEKSVSYDDDQTMIKSLSYRRFFANVLSKASDNPANRCRTDSLYSHGDDDSDNNQDNVGQVFPLALTDAEVYGDEICALISSVSCEITISPCAQCMQCRVPFYAEHIASCWMIPSVPYATKLLGVRAPKNSVIGERNPRVPLGRNDIVCYSCGYNQVRPRLYYSVAIWQGETADKVSNDGSYTCGRCVDDDEVELRKVVDFPLRKAVSVSSLNQGPLGQLDMHMRKQATARKRRFWQLNGKVCSKTAGNMVCCKCGMKRNISCDRKNFEFANTRVKLLKKLNGSVSLVSPATLRYGLEVLCLKSQSTLMQSDGHLLYADLFWNTLYTCHRSDLATLLPAALLQHYLPAVKRFAATKPMPLPLLFDLAPRCRVALTVAPWFAARPPLDVLMASVRPHDSRVSYPPAGVTTRTTTALDLDLPGHRDVDRLRAYFSDCVNALRLVDDAGDKVTEDDIGKGLSQMDDALESLAELRTTWPPLRSASLYHVVWSLCQVGLNPSDRSDQQVFNRLYAQCHRRMTHIPFLRQDHVTTNAYNRLRMLYKVPKPAADAIDSMAMF